MEGEKMKASKSLIFFCGFLLAGWTAYGATINVPGDYPTIQAGLNAASAGDTVLVADGTYTENIVWPQTDNITLISANGSDTTVIDGSGAQESCIFIGNGQQGVKLDGFTLQNGYGSIPTFHSEIKFGGGILVDEDVTAIIANSHIINNGRDEGEYSGGVFVSINSDVTIESCIVADNDAAGIYYRSFSSNGAVRNCLIINNGVAATDYLWQGSGIYTQSSPIQIYNNSIANNAGHGLLFYTPLPTVKNNIISGNNGYAMFSGQPSSNEMLTYNNLWMNSQGDYFVIYNPEDDVFIVGTNGNISSDPLFVGGAPFDYHLTQGSPCRNTGTSAGAPNVDFEGDARPSGAGFDMGADEFLEPDQDTDNDGTMDSNDGCPLDPNKITPGICGCGIPDTDSDGDGTPDCVDTCPDDPDKIVPGDCGCGIPDKDSDGDGTPDCNDGCPADPGKIEPGVCGCGVVDSGADRDGDGTPDCVDGCPDDPDKLTPGACGCGISDVDTDGDGTPDCSDDTPNGVWNDYNDDNAAFCITNKDRSCVATILSGG
ncbi:MAG: right-handed parallel beta-helix repeat-containing protein [Thermodesulfobacteriota bacterium]